MQADTETKGVRRFHYSAEYETLGHMRLWAWDFVSWAGREMGLVADAYWWCINAIPTAATQRTRGLLRHPSNGVFGSALRIATAIKQPSCGRLPTLRIPSAGRIVACKTHQVTITFAKEGSRKRLSSVAV